MLFINWADKKYIASIINSHGIYDIGRVIKSIPIANLVNPKIIVTTTIIDELSNNKFDGWLCVNGIFPVLIV